MADGETIPETQAKTYAEIASSEDTSSKDQTCGGSGHKSNYCTSCPNDWLCQTCGQSGHTAQYCNADTVSSSEDSQSESDSDSDNKSSHQEKGKYDKPQSPDLSNSKNSFTFNKQISETVEKQDSNKQNNQSKQNEKVSDTNSTDEKRQVRKAKRQKAKKDRLHRSSSDQQSMDHFLKEAFRTPSQKSNDETRTRNKQNATTPTDELHAREEPVKKTKS
ncbi:unnamed protein product [Mytilus coruscus]|uniref:CCHC-type domain-containing protein n=1 Tax=Mytilus coruscus TaxID=42192 RepID=A0A6J8C282_MYTCO|nr:unnamed protein product [Mytilus coruscus]